MNLAIVCIFFLVGLIINNSIIDKIININLSLMCFNILPAYPLDGSRILELYYQKKYCIKRLTI